MNGSSLGSVERGQTFTAMISNRGEDGNQATGFAPTHYDVVDPITMDVMPTFGDVALLQETDYQHLFWIQIDTSGASFGSGRTYGVVIKEGTGEPSVFRVYNFTILPHDADFTRIDNQLVYLRNNQENVLFPRTKRLLGLQGENQMLDQFSYDAAGNITAFRIRLFSDSIQAALATRDIADSDIPEVGEISTYHVTQAMSAARSLRTEHRSVADNDNLDTHVDDNQDTGQDFAAGNEGGWPTS
jgi:hypothetical protein